MEKLPKDVAKYLKMLYEHDRDVDYFTLRFSDMGFDEIAEEVLLIRSLERHGMIETTDHVLTKTIEIPNPTYVDDEGIVRMAISGAASVTYPTGFSLTADGKAYHAEAIKEAIYTASGSVVAAVLGGFFAWLFIFLLG